MGVVLAAEKSLLLDDFQGVISGGPEGTVDFGAGNGSSVEVSAAADIARTGKQSLKVAFEAVPGGYIYVARGFGLNAKNTAWSTKPEEINWKEYNVISFYMYGSGSKAKVAFDLKDAGGEIWRFIAEDNSDGWKRIICPFQDFFARSDWQPDNADKNAVLDFPLKSYQFEPLPEAKGKFYFSAVELSVQ